MPKKRLQEPSAAAATPWLGRLRSHSSPHRRRSPRLSGRIKNRDEEEEQAAAPVLKKQAASAKNRRPSPSEAAAGVRRRSLRLAAGELERLSGAREPRKESKVKGNQSVIQPLRRSPRLHSEINNGENKLGNSKSFAQKNSGKPLLKKKKKSYHKLPPLSPNAQEVAPCKEIKNAFSRNSKKRKISIEEKPLPKKKLPREVPPLGPNAQEITPNKEIRNALDRKSVRKSELKPEIGKGRTRMGKKNHQKPPSLLPNPQEIDSVSCAKTDRRGRSIEEEDVNGREGTEECRGSDEWTEQQDMALHQAYFAARPSPHFWKKVSKMVPGKSADECFNRIHADLKTPTPVVRRSRLTAIKSSPLGSFTLSDPKIPNLLESKPGRRRSTMQKCLAAQKTVRHLLKKHCLIDQAKEADHFSVFETSPSALQLNISVENSPGTPDILQSSSARRRAPSRFLVQQGEPSPAVLKPVKNAVLHEKYINQLSRRDAGKRPRSKASSSMPTDCLKKDGSELQPGGLKTARTALISEATDFISHFKKLQTNSFAHFVENSEDDEDDGNGCGTDGYCNDDDEE